MTFAAMRTKANQTNPSDPITTLSTVTPIDNVPCRRRQRVAKTSTTSVAAEIKRPNKSSSSVCARTTRKRVPASSMCEGSASRDDLEGRTTASGSSPRGWRGGRARSTETWSLHTAPVHQRRTESSLDAGSGYQPGGIGSEDSVTFQPLPTHQSLRCKLEGACHPEIALPASNLDTP
jgi:hypothetical protein